MSCLLSCVFSQVEIITDHNGARSPAIIIRLLLPLLMLMVDHRGCSVCTPISLAPNDDDQEGSVNRESTNLNMTEQQAHTHRSSLCCHTTARSTRLGVLVLVLVGKLDIFPPPHTIFTFVTAATMKKCFVHRSRQQQQPSSHQAAALLASGWAPFSSVRQSR